MKKTKSFLAIVAVSLALASCGGSGDGPQVDYIPVQGDKDGNWGMVAPDGEPLFADEFKNRPTQAYNGRFMVKNADDLWEIYTAASEPQKVGKEYKQAGLFYEDVAPVVEKGKNIDFIDRDGNVKFTLDKVDGKPVTSVTNFRDGLSVFRVDDCYGCIDASGDVVVKPDYCMIEYPGDGKMFAKHKKYADAESASAKISVLDRKGNVLFEFNEEKFSPEGSFRDGKAIVLQEDESETRYGIIDDKGEWVVKPSAKLRRIADLRGDNFIFYDGESWGLMNTEGETLLRAKYESLSFLTPERLAAKDKDEYTIIDLEGNEVGKNAYEEIYACHDGKHAFAKESKDSYVVIDMEGNPVDKKQGFYDFGGVDGDEVIESDFVDVPAIVNAVLGKDGLIGLSDKTPVDQVMKTAMVEEYDEWEYVRQTDVTGFPMVLGESVTFVCFYLEPPLYVNGDGYDYKDDLYPYALAVSFPNYGKIADKTAEIYKQAKDVLKARKGTVILEEETVVAYEFPNCVYLVAKGGVASIAVIYKTEKTIPYMEDLLGKMVSRLA